MEIRHILGHEASFPPSLKEAYQPPKELFLRGTLPDGPKLGVVGTRKMSPYGRQCVELLIPPIARLGIVIVSGLAFGIDAAAHETTMAAGGKTVAVIGSGVDEASVYPRAHLDLARRMIARGGGVLSEYPAGTLPYKNHFPERNRIIAGLSRAVLVIEAPKRSGAMITARLALEMGREILAVPGPITHPNAWGPNELIRNGATPVSGAEDISEIFGMTSTASLEGQAACSEDERAALDLLKNSPLTADELARQLRKSPSELLSLLTGLEMKNLVRSFGGSRYGLIQ